MTVEEFHEVAVSMERRGYKRRMERCKSTKGLQWYKNYVVENESGVVIDSYMCFVRARKGIIKEQNLRHRYVNLTYMATINKPGCMIFFICSSVEREGIEECERMAASINTASRKIKRFNRTDIETIMIRQNEEGLFSVETKNQIEVDLRWEELLNKLGD